MEIFSFWFHRSNAINLVTSQFDTPDGLKERGSTKSNLFSSSGRYHLDESVDMMDIKRGCCGAVFVILLVSGCLAINIIAKL